VKAQDLINFTEKFISKTNFWYGEIKGLKLFDSLPNNIKNAYNYVNLIFDGNYRFFLLQDKENEYDYALLACSFTESETDLAIDKLYIDAKDLNELFDIIKKKHKHKEEKPQEETLKSQEFNEDNQDVEEVWQQAETKQEVYLF
jgi:hypothetical protein